MKKNLFLFLLPLFSFLFCLTGCNATARQRPLSAPPSLAPATARIQAARTTIKEVQVRVSDPVVVKQLATAQEQLSEAQRQLDHSQASITQIHDDLAKSTEELTYITGKYESARGLLWKWRLISFSGWGLLALWILGPVILRIVRYTALPSIATLCFYG